MMSRRSWACLLLLGVVALCCLELAVAEGQHYLKRSYRKKELSCRKECEEARRRGPYSADYEGDDGSDDADEWNGVAVIETSGGEGSTTKRSISPCVARCISSHCYNLEYIRPLEMGEIDERYDFFRQCVTAESAETRKRRSGVTNGYNDEDDY